MKNLYLVLLVLLLFPLSGFSQGQNDNWVFGDHAAVNFSLGSPVAVTGSQMDAPEDVATVSDDAGNLLFYTEGDTIWSKNHQYMQNGILQTNITQGESAVVITPYPGHPDQYLVFRVSNNTPNPSYSVVDMTQNNGLGAVTSFKNPMATDASGSTTFNGTGNMTVLNNGYNFWVLIAYQQKLLAYKVDYAGVDTIPVESTINQVGPVSHIRVSPDQNYLVVSGAYCSQPCPAAIYNFNAATGMVQGPPVALIYPSQESFFSSAFSSNSDVLWLTLPFTTSNLKIYGIDMNNFSAPPTILTTSESPDAIQRGPDGEIYVSLFGSNYLGRINNSNNLSTATFSPTAVFLNNNRCRAGLPQLVPSPYLCIPDLTLTGNYTPLSPIIYEVSNKITTLDYYALPILCQITMSAENYIEMLPNTELASWEHGVVLAKIDGCGAGPLSKPTSMSTDAKNYETKIIYLPGNEIADLQIYPNPVIDVLNISIPDEMDIKSAIMYDLLGKPTRVNLGENNTINMSKMAPGVYILKLETNQGTMTKKIIKN